MEENIFIFGASGLLGRSIFKIFKKSRTVYGTYSTNIFESLIKFNYNEENFDVLKKFFI